MAPRIRLVSPPPPPNREASTEGIEAAVSAHHARMFTPRSSNLRFRANLALLLAVALLGTWWFTRHLQPYVTEVALIGGSVTLWAAVRLAWEVIGKATGFDAWAQTRKSLASVEFTVLMVAASLALLVAWAITSSIYLEFDPGEAKADRYTVSIGTASAPASFMAATVLSAGQRVAGRPVFGVVPAHALWCYVTEPADFEPRDCTLSQVMAKTVRVPGDMAARQILLLRLLPSPALLGQLPPVGETAHGTAYLLEVSIDSRPALRLADLRKQSVSTGAGKADLDKLLAQPAAQAEALRARLGDRLRAKGMPEANAAETVSVLLAEPRSWDGLQVKTGQKLRFVLRATSTAQAADPGSVVRGFPFDYVVTAEAAQDIWLPPMP